LRNLGKYAENVDFTPFSKVFCCYEYHCKMIKICNTCCTLQHEMQHENGLKINLTVNYTENFRKCSLIRLVCRAVFTFDKFACVTYNMLNKRAGS
jgi:hypothetical protein